MLPIQNKKSGGVHIRYISCTPYSALFLMHCFQLGFGGCINQKKKLSEYLYLEWDIIIHLVMASTNYK